MIVCGGVVIWVGVWHQHDEEVSSSSAWCDTVRGSTLGRLLECLRKWATGTTAGEDLVIRMGILDSAGVWSLLLVMGRYKAREEGEQPPLSPLVLQ